MGQKHKNGATNTVGPASFGTLVELQRAIEVAQSNGDISLVMELRVQRSNMVTQLQKQRAKGVRLRGDRVTFG